MRAPLLRVFHHLIRTTAVSSSRTMTTKRSNSKVQQMEASEVCFKKPILIFLNFSLASVLPPSDRLVWVDCEMSGLDLDKDVLLEIAMIVTEVSENRLVAVTCKC